MVKLRGIVRFCIIVAPFLQILQWSSDSRQQENIMVKLRGIVRFCIIVAPFLLVCLGLLLHFTKKTPVLKINLAYSAIHHPLAPPYPYPYKFLINQPDKCKDRTPFLILMVMGRVHDLDTRHVIRATWGNESNYDVDVLRIFVMGFSRFFPNQIQMILEKESEVFGDIVQQDFMDTYYNLTLKTLLGMEWVTKFCPNASYVMKIDNDMFLNVDYLVHKLLRPELPVRENYFTGYIVENAPPSRSKVGKFYVPEEIYPSDIYPPYCAGPGYVFSADMARKIYNISQKIQVIPMEDSFMGICLYALQIPLTPPPMEIFNGDHIVYNRCQFHKLIMVHHYTSEELWSIWPDFWTLKSSGCK